MIAARFLHGRRLDVNLVAGGFRKDLLALADETPHDERYERPVEYARSSAACSRRRGRTGSRARYFGSATCSSGQRSPRAAARRSSSLAPPPPAGPPRGDRATAVKYPQPPTRRRSTAGGRARG